MRNNLLGFLLLTFALAFSAGAQENARELHLFAAYEGNIRTGDRIHGPEVEIEVSRPGQTVILALSPRQPIRFLVSLDATTELADVYFVGPRSEKSEIYVNGEKREAKLLSDVPFVSGDIGFSFRQALARLSRIADVDRAASVQVLKRVPEGPAIINTVSDLPRLRAVYLRDLVKPDRLNDAFRAVIDGKAPATSVQFDSDGFVLTENGVVTRYPITLDVPRVSHPVATAYDAEGKRIYGATLGGEGFIYRYDIDDQTWSVVTSMNQEDATGMVYDPVGDRLILAVYGNPRSKGSLREWSEAGGLRQLNLGIKVDDLPGLTDIFDNASGGPLPAVIPLAISGNELLVRTVPPRFARHRRDAAPMSRTYIFDMDTSRTVLVSYHGD